MEAALVITWKQPRAGREKQALEYAAESGEYWGKLASEGKCSVPDWYFLPDGWAIWIVKGERRVLEDIIAEEATARLLTRGLWLTEDWQYRLAEAGSGAEKFIGDYAAVGGQLGLL